jgi:hypothetical protein
MKIKRFWKICSALFTILFTLTFAASGIKAQPPPPPPDPTGDTEWQVAITVKIMELLPVEVNFGVNPESKDGLDDMDVLGDLVPPPQSGPYLNALFAAERILKTDIRPTIGPWTLIVKSNRDLTLSWDTSAIPPGVNLILDPGEGIAPIDMAAIESETFDAGNYQMTIRSGYAEFTLNLTAGINLISLPHPEVLDAEGNPVTLTNASDLASVLGDSLSYIIYLAEDGIFQAYLEGDEDDIQLRGDAGYILVMQEAASLVFRGSGWPEIENIPLSQGLNVIGLPLELEVVSTFSALWNAISEGVVSYIIYLGDDNLFQAFILGDADIPLTGGMGLIVVMEGEGSLPSSSGTPWSQ